MKIDLNLLKVFATVYQEKSLSRAGEKLFVTTPAVSQNIKKLKESLGEELFVLSNRQFIPTPYSDDLYRKVQPLLDGISLAITESKEFVPADLTESFRLEINPHIQSWLTLKLYKEFYHQSPNLTLISHTISPNTLDSLTQGSIDMAIHFETDNLPPEIVAIPMTQLQFIIAVRSGHPFKKETARMDELLQYPVAHTDLAYLDPNKHSRLEEEVVLEGKEIKVSLRTTSIAALLEVIKCTDTIVPCLPQVIEQYPNELRKIEIVGMDQIRTMDVHAFIHRKNLGSKKFDWLLNLVEETLSSP
ncbi:LysR family transcriptional regulator [Vibrio superstes]|uniref:LysR family transcriptional regulator n=1 Tax=Vibrio superstes NBRC 103154 TaxID=1219062 RepID=A0A511QKF2_9VIBR|nr:LysR family transcriptional regulator [Vibrio superstes]GEM77804.1 LysR family transcriptional regulator [Vibrio superstes NBRC 103154]